MKSDDGKKLENILKTIFLVNFLGYKQSNMKLFWMKLRLALPSVKKNIQIKSISAMSDLPIININQPQPVTTKVNFLMLTKSKGTAEVLL